MNIIAQILSAKPLARYDPDAAAFFRATGLIDPEWRTRVNSLVLTLKANGFWSRIKLLHMLYSPSESVSMTCLRSLRFARNLGTTFVPNGYIAGDGTAAYVHLSCTPESLNLAVDSVSWAADCVGGVDTPSNSNTAVGQTSSNTVSLVPRAATSSLASRLHSGSTSVLGSLQPTIVGFWNSTRRGPTDVEGYRNGVSIGVDTDVSSTVGTFALTLLKNGSSYGPLQLSGLVVAMDAVSDADAATLDGLNTAFKTNAL